MTIFTYLDDWLIVGRSQAATAAALAQTRRLTARLGFLVNSEKSRPVPSQCPRFLGASLDLRAGLARPTEECAVNLRQCVSLFLAASSAPA